MGWWRWLKRRFDVVFHKGAAERELDDEIQFHIDMEIRSLIRDGVSPREARRRALVAFGGVERYKERVRDVRGARFLDDWIQDSRVALRSLARRPGFLVAVVLTLGIGIGGTVAMFGVIERSLYRALPYPDSEDLVLGRVVWDGEIGFTVSGPDFFDYRDATQSLTDLAALTPFPVRATVIAGGEAERVSAPLASVGFFETFRLQPAQGRFFLPEEGEAGGPSVAVVSHGYWQRRFAGGPIVGTTLVVDGTATTVVGVAPEGFRFLLQADLWRPIQRDVGSAQARQFHNFVLVGRLAAGRSVAVAQAEVDATSATLEDAYPETNRNKGLNLTPLREALAGQYQPTLVVLFGAVAALLLIACANVAGLLLARGGARRAEMAIRSVMGAGRARLIKQLLTENVYLALTAGLVGVLLATWIQEGVLAFMPMDRLGAVEAGLSAPMLVFALVLCLAAVLLFGVVPALRVAGVDPAEDLKAAGRGRSGERGGRFRNGLVVSQVAMTAVLLAVSGLLLRSFAELTRVDSGFETERLLTAEVSVPRAEYPGAEAGLFFTELIERVEALPGVSSATVTTHLPVQDPGGNIRVSLPEDFGSEGVLGSLAYRRSVMPGYFEALGIPRLSGRDVSVDDDPEAPPVVVISESLSSLLFGTESPLGRTIAVDQGGTDPAWREVVGVVGDVTTGSPAATDGDDLAMYYPYGQSPSSRMRLAVRAQSDLTGVVSGVREILRSMDPAVPLSEVTTMDEALAGSVAGQRTIAILLTLFAAVALLLAAVGLYGVLAYQVSRRIHEIGVRMALGASVGAVVRGILGGGLRLVVIGLAVGIPGALVAGRLVQGMLFGVAPTDPLTLLGVTAFLTSVALAASLFPARRAALIDPVEAFRSD